METHWLKGRIETEFDESIPFPVHTERVDTTTKAQSVLVLALIFQWN